HDAPYAASDRRLRFGVLLPGVGFMSSSIAATSCFENRMDRPSRRCGQPPFSPCSYMRQRRQMVSTVYWCLCAMSSAVKYTSDFASAMVTPYDLCRVSSCVNTSKHESGQDCNTVVTLM